MGTATEKLQHSLQNIPNAAGQQHKEETKTADEVKRTTVQNAEDSNQSNSVNKDGAGHKQERRKKNSPAENKESSSALKNETSTPENGNGRTINLVV